MDRESTFGSAGGGATGSLPPSQLVLRLLDWIAKVRIKMADPEAPHWPPECRGADKEALRSRIVQRVTSQMFFNGMRDAVRTTRILYDSLRIIYGQAAVAESRRNPDLAASADLRRSGCSLHGDRMTVGRFAGICVGDVFMFRGEMTLIGLHILPEGYMDFGQLPDGVEIATSLILPSCDLKKAGVFRYTSNDLALQGSLSRDAEVRVLHCFDCQTSPSKKVFVYDGVYRVIDSWDEDSDSIYELVRVDGQGELGSKTMEMAAELKRKLDAGENDSRYLASNLSESNEDTAVALFNDIDDDRSPLQFQYLLRPKFPKPTKKRGCSCTSGCKKAFPCVQRNRNGHPYDANGYLRMGREVVHECGPACRCRVTCRNRSTQRPMRFRLEVFRKRDETMWGVRSLDVIPAGSYVCEFSGVAKRTLAPGSSSFVDARYFQESWKQWGFDARTAIRSPQGTAKFTPPFYKLDISENKNVACYLLDSNLGNLFVQYVTRRGEDELFPHLAVFSLENIPPLRELTLNYKGIVKKPSYGSISESISGQLSLTE